MWQLEISGTTDDFASFKLFAHIPQFTSLQQLIRLRTKPMLNSRSAFATRLVRSFGSKSISRFDGVIISTYLLVYRTLPWEYNVRRNSVSM